ncbi:hypothetical protein [Methylobacterium sp. Leaf88]|uniref:hypothetical protein n=1 Tax=Methylobacterium sp. Leaf88 TaxID=1736244 RepID=UPI0006FE4C56|nr:hypothetical protein [Methylobacterium sp. Leaf88]KQO77865.1 hypothetical protein ASF20_12885 [Methylobacterium sp. Leaf88]
MDIRLREEETNALAYHRAARGDAWAALVQAVEDAPGGLAEAERRTAPQRRLISRGYIRDGAITPDGGR